MKKSLTLAASAIIAFLLIDPATTLENDVIETEQENPGERAIWEFNRLRDPKTNKIPQGFRKAELQFSKAIKKEKDLVVQKTSDLNLQNEWIHRGPFNQGGRTRAIAVDINNENIILAGSASGGMWRSEDGGQSWYKVTPPGAIQSVTCVVQDTRPGKTNTWYYGTGEFLGTIYIGGTSFPPMYEGDGIFKSTDNGKTWFQLESTRNKDFNKLSKFDYIWKIVIDESNLEEDEIYVAAVGGIYKSVDGGETWSDSLVPYTDYNLSSINDVDITKEGVLYACLGNLTYNEKHVQFIFRSEDGENWKGPINDGYVPVSDSKFSSRLVLDISENNPDLVYFLTHTKKSGEEDNKLLLYNDADSSWEFLNLPAIIFKTQGGYNLTIGVHPQNPKVVVIGTVELIRLVFQDYGLENFEDTQIGGNLEVLVNYPNHHVDQHALFFSYNNPDVVYSGHDGGISKTNNIRAENVVWESLNNGYITSQFYAVALDYDTPGDPTVVGGMQDNEKMITHSPNEASNWNKLPFGGDGTFCAIDKTTSSVYFSNQSSTIFRQWIENGDTLYSYLKPDDSNKYRFINPFILNPSNKKQMFLPKDNVIMRADDLTLFPAFYKEDLFSSTTKPEYWTELTNTASRSFISALSMSTTPKNILYYGTGEGQIFRVDNAHEGNRIPVECKTRDLPDAYVGCLAVNPENGDEVIAVFTNYNVQSLFRTLDGGNSWEAIGGNLEEYPDGSGSGPSCRWVTIMPLGDETYYFVATSTGLYSTNNLNGMNTEWIQQGSEKIGNVVVDMVISRPSDGTVVAGTHANGVFSTQLNVTELEEANISLSDYRLEQNFPNPFNPSTTISYSLPEATQVSLKVFDALGREIAELVNTEKSAGSYKIDFNASNLSSGIYFYILETDRFVKTRKMLLLK